MSGRMLLACVIALICAVGPTAYLLVESKARQDAREPYKVEVEVEDVNGKKHVVKGTVRVSR